MEDQQRDLRGSGAKKEREKGNEIEGKRSVPFSALSFPT